ncbi:MAG: D-alanyl-D-alanine carboxypeptidase [Clostridiaceae bacterium]|nr:D-alanyl-D-alanine carboxypeptidase [Clostridiaceae bacterium]
MNVGLKTKFYRVLILILIFVVFSCSFIGMSSLAFAADGQDKPQTDAVSALLFDARRGQVILSKASDELSHSSLANRIMSVLITLERADIDAMVTASKDAANTKGATLSLTVGEKYAVKNLLYALLLTGSPDASIAIAEYVGGSEDGFIKIMNEYAANLGMTDTVFVNCTGEYHENQVTTANDIAILMKYALSNSNFNRFFGTQAKPWYDNSKTLLLTNTNNMFWSYPGTDGGLTASIDNEIQSLVTTATKNNMRLVCVLLDVPTKNMYTDSIAYLDYGFDNYLYGILVSAGVTQQTITVEGQNLNLIATTDVQYIYPKGQNFIKNIDINIDETKLKPPITKNTLVGMLTYTLLDDTVINIELYPDREILPQKTTRQILGDRLRENKELLYLITGLIIIEIIIIIYKSFMYIRKKAIKARVRKKSKGKFY